MENIKSVLLKISDKQKYINLPLSFLQNHSELELSLNNHLIGKYTTPQRIVLGNRAYIFLGDFLGKRIKVKGEESLLNALKVDSEPEGEDAFLLPSQEALSSMSHNGVKMVYTPSQGKIWDPSIIWHENYYYLFSMHNAGQDAYGMWGAKSKDGVHWEELGPVIKNAPFKIWKMFVIHNGEHFVINHGSFSDKPGHGNDTLRHWKSKDGVHWEYLGNAFDTHPDPLWYDEKGRWDHMYMVPDEAGEGWKGYCVANILEPTNRGFACLKSEDGINWKVLPPMSFDWGQLMPTNMEFAGVEKIGGKYYAIGGLGANKDFGNGTYSVFTFVSDGPEGPFKPDLAAFRLCGASGPIELEPQWLAAFGRGKDNEIIITNYVGSQLWGMEGPKVTLLPIKKAIIDKKGHLRQGYWQNNDLAKGIKKQLESYKINSVSVRTINMLETKFNISKGVIFEGEILVNKGEKDGPGYAGFYLEHKKEGQGAGILLEIGDSETSCSRIGLIRNIEDISIFEPVDYLSGSKAMNRKGIKVANVIGLKNGFLHTFRLWIRQGLFELYIDDIHVQTFFTGDTNGKIGLLGENAEIVYKNISCWEMNLK